MSPSEESPDPQQQSSPFERGTVSVLEPGIVLVVNPSELPMEITLEIEGEIANQVQEKGWDKFWLISDVRVTKLPNTPVRHELSSHLDRLEPQLNGVLVVLGGNVVMRAAARFVYQLSSSSVPLTFHKDIDEALQTIMESTPDNPASHR